MVVQIRIEQNLNTLILSKHISMGVMVIHLCGSNQWNLCVDGKVHTTNFSLQREHSSGRHSKSQLHASVKIQPSTPIIYKHNHSHNRIKQNERARWIKEMWGNWKNKVNWHKWKRKKIWLLVFFFWQGSSVSAAGIARNFSYVKNWELLLLFFQDHLVLRWNWNSTPMSSCDNRPTLRCYCVWNG